MFEIIKYFILLSKIKFKLVLEQNIHRYYLAVKDLAMHKKPHYKLDTGSRVAVVGGGPAGSSFALYLMQYAKQKNVYPDVTIYQERDFNMPGPRGCKGCAGITYPSMLRNLQECNLTVPDELIQSRIERYAIHNPYSSIIMGGSSEKTKEIMSVYRGNGPRISHTRCVDKKPKGIRYLLR
jgi:hypothetical protein